MIFRRAPWPKGFRAALIIAASLVITRVAHTDNYAIKTQCPKLPNPSSGALQLIVVTAPDWNTQQATLKLFKRQTTAGRWQPTHLAFPVVIGKNGLGWGYEFLAAAAAGAALAGSNVATTPDPRKKEGDGKSPAGVFTIKQLFGYDATPKNKKWRHKYKQLVDATYCIDDETSPNYNQIIDTSDPKLTQNSKHNEKMRAQVLYKFGAEIGYGSSREDLGGSCIFMHIWKAPDHGTAGCVAMDEKQLAVLIHWLKPEAKPAIALFTTESYAREKRCLGLP